MKVTPLEEAQVRISEIFGPTVQGEGPLIGTATVFVRTGGCDFRCVWCDTEYAVDPSYKSQWSLMSSQQILQKIQQLDTTPMLVTISGGNPALQPLGELLDLGHAAGYRFAMETQGSVAKDWFSKLDYLVLSPKPPSSKMTNKWQEVDRCLQLAADTDVSFKIVVKDDVDFQFAQQVARRYPNYPMALQPCNTEFQGDANVQKLLYQQRWLTEKVLSEQWYQVRVLPQLHTLLWGNTPGR